VAGNDHPVLELRGVSKRFPGVYALQNVDFDVRPGEVHALLGENGAGKSTLIKIMAGLYLADEGSYVVQGQEVTTCTPQDAHELGINVVFQELNLVRTLPVSENVFFGHLPHKSFGRVDWDRLHRDTARLLSEVGLNVNPRTRVGLLSVAQQQLVEIARALSYESKVIAMDEPTSALSYTEIEGLFTLIEKLKSQGVAVIYVSHKLEELFRITDRITVLRDGKKVGGVNTAETTDEELIQLMVGRKLESLFPKIESKHGETVLEVRNLTSAKIKDMSFEVKRGEIVGFSGLMGAGRTELARALFGIDRTTGGEILLEGDQIPRNSPVKAAERGLGYIPEDRKEQGLMLTASVQNNMTISILKNLVKNLQVNTSMERETASAAVDRLRIKTPSLDQRIATLSGGNQQKVILARWLIKENLKVLILDEPTRGVDVNSKSEIYGLISEVVKRGVSVLIMSSELLELLSLCDRIYVVKEGELVDEFAHAEATQEKLMSSAVGGA
jgi:ABC-type sugar transport system ATPase subunit